MAHRVNAGEFDPDEAPLETAWTFWSDKKTSDKKESDQYMEGLKQLGSFNTVQGFFRHYAWLQRATDLPRDHSVLLFRKGYKPMWEEFPDGGCWIVRIKRKLSPGFVNHMWENLMLACIGEAFAMPDVVGCVLSTRVKDDVLSIWNLSNRMGDTRFRIGEKLKEILALDMNALIQYKDHMQSLQDYSTYRNAKNYMFAPSPSVTPQQHATPIMNQPADPSMDQDFDGLLPPAAIDDLLPPAAIDSEGFAARGKFPA
uniref:eIF4E-2 n=1 Tax=Amphidinium carterae TaxID=2961 RepID=A0A109QBD6_AMPCA|nr:eIF4E-2 [Amphidinium carterae]|mmetsp:Transcript_41439/g.95279  ORF Transcript_41439/g.95279 Transcript_41439/m.95279 type:complete len:256 (+) Transcript_41439:56-823(+)